MVVARGRRPTGKSFELHDTAPEDPRPADLHPGAVRARPVIRAGGGKSAATARRAHRAARRASGRWPVLRGALPRHPGLKATVVDSGKRRSGRQIVPSMTSVRLSSTARATRSRSTSVVLYDGACFNLIYHPEPRGERHPVPPDPRRLEPGGRLAVLDLFTPRRRTRRPPAFLGLFFYLYLGCCHLQPGRAGRLAAEAGFKKPRRVKMRRIPGQGRCTRRRSPLAA